MGNHLVGMAPAQIFPVEHYLNDGAIKDLQFVKSLGSTRFFKVALTRHVPTQTLIVVKIFTLQDISLQLRTDRDKILAIKKALEDTPNCLTFQRACSTERAGFVIRQYMKHSVYDRMSTRPFLTVMEKKWIAFQLLLAIQQAHKHKICHGDIKLENVMVTSWNWVYLTDFASFKPTFLPEDNPADFSYFFDTSRRRTCYIAPERFKSSHPTGFDAMLAANSQYLPNTNSQSIIENGELLPSMDIFSVGCCLIELFTESSPFTFSHLLAYRAGEFAPTKVLDKIEDTDIRTLVEQMIQKDPSKRLSANECLSQQKGQAFPQFFYSFLQSYMQIFCTESSMMPDNKINKLHENVDSILKMLETEPDFDGHGLTLLVTLVTANIRSLRFSDSKLQALSILTKMSQHVANDILLDRVLPYVIHLLNDRFPAVRIGALQALTDCLKFVSQVPLADANIFPEYILPSVVPLCHDKCELVRSSLARVIADLAQESVRLLDLTLKSGDFCPSDRTLSTYDNEVALLQNSFHEIVSVLLSDSVNSVKQSLLEHSVKKLAVFFGRVKANDVLLSHMITFLNDKDDAYLRDSFYQSIGGVVAFVGWQCSQILLPLLQQGLCDSEEFVIVRCINAMAELTSLGMLEKISLHSLLKETVPYLIHPNLWIRQATCDFISSAAKQMSEVDVLVKLGRILEPFVREEVIQVQTPAIVFSKLHEHLPRDLFEMVLKSGDIDGLLSILETRRTKRAMSNFHLGGTSGMNPVLHAEVPTPMQQLLKRLQNEGMSPEVEDQLLMYREHLIKMAQNRANFKLKKFDGMVDLTRYMAKYNLELREEHLNIDPRANLIRPIPEHQHIPPVNEEWQQLFGPEASPGPDYASETQSGLNGPGSNLSTGRSVSPSQSGATTSPRRSRTPQPPSIEKSYEPSVKWETNRNAIPDQDPGFYPQCKITLDHLLRTKRGEYALHAKKRAQLGYGNACDKSLPSYDWRLQGTLLTHLHEHEMGIVQLARIPDRPIFVSASLDGTVRLWDISSFETSSIVDRSQKQYREFEGCPLTSLDVSGAGDLMATSAENGSICVQRNEAD